ncbi:MORN repeat-containing protein 5 isoform X1 [Nothobranchius furzeri]|uniref:MORN repeat-containing protein 5 isoform X1 n=1 Tax=Nothobranchius furzeri TaxID=105023 RepID=UPI0039048844
MDITGSSYKGSTQNGRMDGEGEYTFPTDTKYVGGMKDGMFHGKGVLFFPNGSKYEATWENGLAIKGSLTFADGLQYRDRTWDYCDGYDRRFYSERCNGLTVSGDPRMTDLRPIPDGCYDCVDGFCDPDTRVITSYSGEFLRNAARGETLVEVNNGEGIKPTDDAKLRRNTENRQIKTVRDASLFW